MTSISLSHLTKVYPQDLLSWVLPNSNIKAKPALSDINLKIIDGQRLGIIGENGAGKSTLLSLIAGVSTPTEGEIIIDGKIQAILTLGLGMREDLSGKENLMMMHTLQGASKEETESLLTKMIDFSELGDFINRPVRTYSSGMKARLAFSGMIFCEPDILLIDEALSVGDYQFGQKATKAMKALCKKGKIAIIVSHGLGSISDLCNRCIWISEGTIKADGEPEVVIAEYRAYLQKKAEERFLKSEKQSDSNGIAICMEGDTFCSPTHLNLQDANSLIVKLTRMDGLFVAHRVWQKEELANKTQLIIPELNLRPGFYELNIEIVWSNKIDKIGQTLKILERTSISGGTPALRWPCEIGWVAENSEVLLNG